MGKIYRETAGLSKVDLFYYDTKGEKPVMICLHGMYGRAETWSDFFSHYADKYRVIAPDLRGHGRSSKPDGYYTYEEMGEDVVELMDRLGIKQAILVGHSMGGGIVGYIASKYPDKIRAAAILDKTAKGPKRHIPVLSSQVKEYDAFTKEWNEVFDTRREALECIKRASGSELETEYFVNSLYEDESGYRFLFSKQALGAYRANEYDWLDLLPQISCKTLLIKSAGEESVTKQDLLDMEACLKDATVYTMSNTNHNVHLAEKEEFYRIFDQFLNTLISGNDF
ncbi:alpha/beta hydrolase [Lacrimispora amygdalina]|uniref:Alpha/beta hydrolase n=1 Tax=Lacrimispora amygdalina TaxID=253257 RepID=A0A3E2N5R7_9FIRM|nr:alpha/beta hydrolase [Clostridium indicum]RFZ76312.1 alpha/beta hydrolase [Clostridium indicum]